MNAVTKLETHKPTPVQAFIGDVLTGDKRDEIARALPAHVDFDRFERNLANALMREPKMLKCDPRVVFREVAKIAALGLVLDPQLGEAYLIVDRHSDVQARVGYRGLLKLAHQSGRVAAISAHDICEQDLCDIDLGTAKRIIHKPNYMADRGKPGAYYATVKFKDGADDFEVMSLAEIHAIRDRSDAWRAYKKGLINSTPWGTDEGEMAKKTVLRRLLKRVPMSPDLDKALASEDEADKLGVATIEHVPTVDRPRNLIGRLDALAGGVRPSGDEAAHDAETGEITEQAGGDDAAADEATANGRMVSPQGAEGAAPHQGRQDGGDARRGDSDAPPPSDSRRKTVIDEAMAKAKRGTNALRRHLATISESDHDLLTSDDHEALGAAAEAADAADSFPGDR